MAVDRVTRVRIQGLRTLADVSLDLQGLTVLIGENGTGKSSIVEALEILHKTAAPTFMHELVYRHGGSASLLRWGAEELLIGADINGEDGQLSYFLRLMPISGVLTIVEERLYAHAASGARVEIFGRTAGRATFFNESTRKPETIEVGQEQLLLPSFGARPPHSAIKRTTEAMNWLSVYLPFPVGPSWANREQTASGGLRASDIISPTAVLGRYGGNFASAWFNLRNNRPLEHWAETMDLVRLGLGDDVEAVTTAADAGGGRIALELKYRGVARPVPSFAISDGTLAYLAFVALARLDMPMSLLAFDEPELHLHPALLMRVLGFFENLAEKHPVVLATHSDRLIDGLLHPAETVILCTLDESRATRLARPDAEALGMWLKRYRGLGDLRAEGYEGEVFPDQAQASPGRELS